MTGWQRVINWKGCGRSCRCLIFCSIPTFAWREWQKHEKPQSGSPVSGSKFESWMRNRRANHSIKNFDPKYAWLRFLCVSLVKNVLESSFSDTGDETNIHSARRTQTPHVLSLFTLSVSRKETEIYVYLLPFKRNINKYNLKDTLWEAQHWFSGTF